MIFVRTDFMPTSLRGRSRAGSASSEFTHVSPEYRHIPPEYIHRKLPSSTEFPAPAGSTTTVSKRDQGLVSPAQSSFSFADNETSTHAIPTPPSPGWSVNGMTTLIDGPEEVTTPTKPADRTSPVDSLTSSAPCALHGTDVTKKKPHYVDDIFAVRDELLSPQEQVYRESIITVEVKTNVIVRDEFLFLDEFSKHMAQRYQCPTSSVFITLEHSACFLCAGSFDSAYIVTITALKSQLTPSANKRNTALVQSHLASSLGVFPNRGVIKFHAAQDEDYATAGTTYLGHIERLQKRPNVPKKTEMVRSSSMKDPAVKADGLKRTPSKKSPPVSTLAHRKIKSTPVTRAPSPAVKSPPMPSIPWDNNPLDKMLEKRPSRPQKLGKRKSFFAIFGKA